MRQIKSLIWARPLSQAPGFAKSSRARGAKAAGLRYERMLAKMIHGAEHGKWFEFEDANGNGFCQVDFLFQSGLIIEAKYTWTPEGHRQIEHLYKPIVEKALGIRAFGGVCCKVLTDEMPRAIFGRSLIVVGTLAEFATLARGGAAPVLHYIGKVPLGSEAPRGHAHPLAPGQLGL